METLFYEFVPDLKFVLLNLTKSQIRNDGNSERKTRVLVGLGDDFESANAAVMYHARNVVSGAEAASVQEEDKKVEALHDEASTKLWQENWYDGLTYCK